MDIKKIIVLAIGILAFIFCAACTGGNNWIEASIPFDIYIHIEKQTKVYGNFVQMVYVYLQKINLK